MSKYLTISILLLLFGCNQDNNKKLEKTKQSYSFFVGTYTDLSSKGIYKYSLNGEGALQRIGLMAVSENPSFLTKSADDKYLLAVNEVDEEGMGGVESFLITEDSLVFINRSSSGGAHPCFVSINKDGYILTANYTGGNIGLLWLNTNGELSELLDIQQHTGSGTTDQQKSPHAHSVWFEPDCENIIAVDLGTNELLFSSLDTKKKKLLPSEPHSILMESGAGPRHLSFHPKGNWMYVLNELNCTVTMLKKIKEGEYEKGPSVSTLPAGSAVTNTCADIHISSDGKFLYASNRGHNSIVIYEINHESGLIDLIDHQITFGMGPRSFSLSPDEKYLLVANQNTNNIVSFKRDSTTGLLKYVDQIEAPIPVCILF